MDELQTDVVEDQQQQEPEDGELVLEIDGVEVTPASDEDVSDGVEVPEDAPTWAKDLRHKHKENAKALKQKEREAEELKQRLAQLESVQRQPAQQQVQSPVADIPPRPTLADHDWDEEAHAAALDQWYGKKAEAEHRKAQQQQQAAAQNQAVQSLVDSHKAKIEELKAPDFHDAAARVGAKIPPELQLVILRTAENSARFVYALDKSPDLLKQVSAIQDPIELAATVARLEAKIQVKRRRADPPATDKPVSGGRVSGNALEALHKKAQQTGDYTEYFRAKKAINK